MILGNTFLYLEPKGIVPAKDHAQCRGCMMWTGPEHETCTAHDPKTQGKFVGDGSCGGYAEGHPMPKMAGKEMGSWTKEESGYVVREVRCENCKHFEKKDDHCHFFMMLNKLNGFDIREKVKPKACCNAQETGTRDPKVATPKAVKEPQPPMAARRRGQKQAAKALGG